MQQSDFFQSNASVRVRSRLALAAIVFVAVTAVLLALGHAHLASKMATAANISRDPAASAMMLNLRGALSGSALVLFSLALLLIVGCQQIQRSIGQKER